MILGSQSSEKYSDYELHLTSAIQVYSLKTTHRQRNGQEQQLNQSQGCRHTGANSPKPLPNTESTQRFRSARSEDRLPTTLKVSASPCCSRIQVASSQELSKSRSPSFSAQNVGFAAGWALEDQDGALIWTEADSGRFVLCRRHAYPPLEDPQAPRPRLRRSRSCRKAPQASRRSWSRWWSAPPPVRSDLEVLPD